MWFRSVGQLIQTLSVSKAQLLIAVLLLFIESKNTIYERLLKGDWVARGQCGYLCSISLSLPNRPFSRLLQEVRENVY